MTLQQFTTELVLCGTDFTVSNLQGPLTKMTTAIGKVLSPNDVGETGAHMAGIYIPKDPQLIEFFPVLDSNEKNPQQEIDFEHDADGTHYTFKFIHYNNAQHDPGGTRDEYRLTRMTEFFRVTRMTSGETLVLYRSGNQYYISDAPPPGGITPTGQHWAVVSIH